MATQQQQVEFVAFRESCVWLQHCYNTFNHLYNSGSDTEQVLKTTAASFFDDLNSILLEYFFLQIRKISDSAATGARENLTLSNINVGLGQAGLMTAEISDLTAKMLVYRAQISDIANRVIAHADKTTALSSGLVGAHAESDLDSFMSNMRSYTDAVGIALGVGPLDYRTQAGPGDVLDLIRKLKRV